MRSSGSACRWKHQTGMYSYWMMLCHMKVITNLTFIIQSPVNAKVNKLEVFFSLLQKNTSLNSLSSQTPVSIAIWFKAVTWLWCLQPSYISLIYTAWLHRRLSTYSVCSPWQWKAPDLLLTVLILGVTLWINSSSTVENWRPQHLRGARRARQNSIWVELGGCKSNHFQSSE